MYKCICGFETSSSNKLKKHMDICDIVLAITKKAPFCYCGKKLKPYIRKGRFLGYQKHCGTKECSKKYMSIVHSGREWSDEHKKNLNKTKYRENIVKHGEFECEKCHKIFATNTSLRAHKATCEKNKDIIFKCDICNKIFKNNAGLQTHLLYKHDNSEHAEYIKNKQHKIGIKIQENNRKNIKHVSKLESIFEVYLKELKIDYIRQFRLRNSGILYFYDFYIPSINLVVEVDGDYWHINPNLYSYSEMPSYIQDYKKIEIEKEAYLIQNGYNIIRFWEYDIKHNLNDVIKRLQDAIRNN